MAHALDLVGGPFGAAAKAIQRLRHGVVVAQVHGIFLRSRQELLCSGAAGRAALGISLIG